MGQLTTACEDYYEEYQQLPLGSITNSDSAQITTTPSTSPQVGSPFMAALLGLKSAEEENYKLTSFFYCKMAKEQKDGLHRIENAAELFDPWGNPYHLVLNYDYDQELREPLAIGNDILYDRKVLIWSTGPDGKSGSDETNEDNIYNWAKSK